MVSRFSGAGSRLDLAGDHSLIRDVYEQTHDGASKTWSLLLLSHPNISTAPRTTRIGYKTDVETELISGECYKIDHSSTEG